jgi:DNA-binding IclR family transcriptional regulator
MEVDTNVSATALKALSVLDYIGEQRRPVTVLQVAESMGADRATAYRMLMTLVQAGYVARDGDKSYRLSLKVLTLARHLVGEDERASHIIATLRAISDATGETVHYSALERDSAVLVFRAKGTQRVTVDLQIGDRSPLHCTSIGKVLLAYGDARNVETIISRGLAKVAPNTITDGDALRRALVTVRAQRYAFDDLEFAPDMRCVALPVFEKGGEVPGGIAISGPSSRFDMKHLEWLRDIALEHATALSRTLGGMA